MTQDISVFNILQNALQAAQMRQQVYSGNIANAETPGYKRQDVNFESLLSAAIEQNAGNGQGEVTSSGLANGANVSPVVVTTNDTAVDNNGNNVDIDAEMAKLAENQIRYEILLQQVKSRFDRTKSAIDGGGG